MQIDAQPEIDGRGLIEARDWGRTRNLTLLLWVGIAVVLLLPSRWTGNDTIHPWGEDVVSYEQIAAAAPDLPDTEIASAYSDRFVPHYAVGLLSDASDLGLHAAYRIVALLCIAATLLVAERIFRALRPPWWIYALGLASFALAPYAVRESILGPGGYQDLVFVLGAGISLLGLLRVRFSIVLLGALLALSGRQTALLFAAAAACWILLAPDWKQALAQRTRLIQAGGLLLGVGVAYFAIRQITASFSDPFAPDSPADTIIFGPPGLTDLAGHLARCADPILIPGTALVTVLLILAAAGLRPRDLPAQLWLCLLLSASIVVQPVVIDPDFPGFSSNEQRLAALGLLPLCAALAIALIEADRRRLLAVTPPMLGAGLALLAVASLHHIFTVVGPSNVKQFAAIQIAVALLFAAGLLYAYWGSAARTASQPSPA
jgi:hypothetical protein